MGSMLLSATAGQIQGPLNLLPVVFFSATRNMMLSSELWMLLLLPSLSSLEPFLEDPKLRAFLCSAAFFSCQMSSLCSLGLAPQWRPKSVRFLFLFHSKRRTSAFVPRVTSSSSIDDDTVSGPKAKQVQYLTPLLFLFSKIAAAFFV